MYLFYITLTIANDIHSNLSSMLSLNKSIQANIKGSIIRLSLIYLYLRFS